MDLDSFLVAPKWDILKIISEKPSSPIEIAEITKTTVSYVSQQLKLLEAIGIVSKAKTGAFEKGMPRNVFSIAEDFAYISVLTNGLGVKKKLAINNHNRLILNIWLLKNILFHKPLEKFFIFGEELLNDVDFVFLDSSKSDISLIFVSEKKGLKSELNSLVKKIAEKIDVFVISSEEFLKVKKDSFEVLYDSKIMLKKENYLKGGIK